ncbi:MAG: glycoside hydrolase family 43 protein [Cytophagales bacterium]|nr:glycoside hydrolase family 43 protein [Cytophagales bacterium]
MINIHNPILPGFHPDPSIIRVDDDFYIATSTFEWFPGVRIHHSKDLENWELIPSSLNRVSQLDMKGAPDSCGVWAPCLSYHEEIYYLVYSNVKSFEPLWGQTPNYLVITKDLTAGWSDPIFLSNEGFDGSLFHDDDGRKWYLSLRLDEDSKNIFGGIILQEYGITEKRLIGEPEVIFEGTELGKTEGPHLYKINGYYYLITAEGGTEYDHAVSVARSKDIHGPYEASPFGPIVCTMHHPEWPLQKTGHGDLVDDGHGNWYVVFLTGRPLTTRGRCTLGRETAMEEIIWEEGWPKLKGPNDAPRVQIGKPNPKVAANTFDDFTSGSSLQFHWQSLREPIAKEWLNIGTGGLTLLGRQSLQSWENQSLIARRVMAFDIEVITELQFKPGSSEEMAGLVFYYNSGHYHYLHLTFDKGRKLKIITCDRRNEKVVAESPIIDGPIQLKGQFIRNAIRFFWKQAGGDWNAIGETLDGSILSDDYVQHDNGTYKAAFTGAFVGLCCQDLSDGGAIAQFKHFQYLENHS